MNKFSLFLTFLFFLVVLSGLGFATQSKLALDTCQYSLGDPNFGSWDSVSGTGTFFELRNYNPVVGQNAEYVGVNLLTTTGTPFSDTFTDDGGIPYGYNSFIPTLEIDSTKNRIYSRCDILVGNNLVVVDNYVPFSLYQTQGLLLTQDFGLSSGIIQEGDPNYNPIQLDYVGSDYVHGVDSLNEFYYMAHSDGKLWQTAPFVKDFVNEGSSGSGLAELRQIILVPNSVLTVDSELILSGVPSGVLTFSTWLTENSQEHTIEPYNRGVFYIDSDYAVSPETFLSPKVDNLQVVINPGQSGEIVCSSNSLTVENNCVYGPGDDVELFATYSNPFGFTLGESNYGQVMALLRGHVWNNGGVGDAGAIGIESALINEGEFVSVGDLDPGESVTRSVVVTLPDLFESVAGEARAFLAPKMTYVVRIGGVTKTPDAIWGGDGRAYLGITRINPEITLAGNSPTFELELDMVGVYSGGGDNIEIRTGDYEILYEIYQSDTLELKESGGWSYDRGSSILYEGQSDKYYVRIPIDPDVFNEPGAKYFVRVYTSPTSGPLAGYKLAGLTANPFFKAGSTTYYLNPDDTSYTLSNDARSDYKVIRLLNPTGDPISLSVSTSGLADPDNLEVVLQRGNQVSAPNGALTITDISRLQAGEVNVTLTGTYSGDPWTVVAGPTTQYSDSFTLRTIDNDGVLSFAELDYDITVLEGNVQIANLVADEVFVLDEEDISTSVIYSGSSASVKGSWHVGGSASGLTPLADTVYDVRFELYRKNFDGDYVLVTGQTVDVTDVFSMPSASEISPEGSNRVDESSTVNLPILAEGDYQVRFYVDSNNYASGGEIGEVIGASSAEGDNVVTYDFTVLQGTCQISCNPSTTRIINSGQYYYNSEDSGIYRCLGSDITERITSGCTSLPGNICQTATCVLEDDDLQGGDDYSCYDGTSGSPIDPVCAPQGTEAQCASYTAGGVDGCYGNDEGLVCTWDLDEGSVGSCASCGSIGDGDGNIFCGAYDNQRACEELSCGVDGSFVCAWDSAASKCKIKLDDTTEDDEGPGGVKENDLPSGCGDLGDYLVSDPVCPVGERFGELSYVHSSDNSCNFNIPYACSGESVQLPFAGYLQIILSLFVIAYVYFIYFFFVGGRKG